MIQTIGTQRSSTKSFKIPFFRNQRREGFRVMSTNTENEKDAALLNNINKRKHLAQDLSHKISLLKRCALRFRMAANVYESNLNQCTSQEKCILGDLGSSLENNNFFNHNGRYIHNSAHEYKQKSIFNLTLGLMKQLKQQKQEHISQRIFRLLLTTIDPIHPFMYFWNLINIMIIFYFIFAIFLEEAFTQEYIIFECKWKEFVLFSLIILVLDLLMGFNVKILVRGELLENKKKITIHYFQNGFIYDLLALFGFTYLSYGKINLNSQCEFDDQDETRQVLKYLFLFKFHRLLQLTKFFDYKFAFNQRMKRQMKLLKLFAQLIMVAHLFACLWIIVGKFSFRFYNINWITKIDQDGNMNNIEMYFKSLYFACMTMTTVGYGDILPTNIMEYILCIFLMIMSSAIFGYTLNTVTSIVQDIYNENEVYNNEVVTLAKYMRKKNISLALQDRVLDYLQCMQAAGLNDDQQEEARILGKLSQSLREGLLLQEKGPMLQGSTAITESFREVFLNKVLESAQEVRFQPGEVVKPQTHSYHYMNESFIYVVRGQLDFFYENTHQKQEEKKMVKLFSLKTGERSGVLNLFGQQIKNQYSIVSEDFTVLYIIKYQDVLNLVYSKQFINSEDRIAYCSLKDEIGLYKNYKGFLLTCQICKGSGHEFQECKKFLYHPLQNIVISKFSCSLNQPRKGFQRNGRSFVNIMQSSIKKQHKKAVSGNNKYDFTLDNKECSNIKLLVNQTPLFVEFIEQESVENEFHNQQEKQPQTNLVQSILNFRKQRLKIINDQHIQSVRQSSFIGNNLSIKVTSPSPENEIQVIKEENTAASFNKTSKPNFKEIEDSLDPETFVQAVDDNRFKFETITNFSNYFSHNNANVVIRKYNTIIQVKQQIFKSKKSKTTNSKIKRIMKPKKKKK